MATEQDRAERERLDARVDDVVEAACSQGGGGLLLPTLHALQNDLGHIPESVVEALAARFNLSRADVHGVITFYRDLTTSPEGVPKVRVCRAEACQAMGAEALLAEVRRRLADPVGDVFCLGNCALGPSAIVDGQVIGRATVDRIVATVAGRTS